MDEPTQGFVAVTVGVFGDVRGWESQTRRKGGRRGVSVVAMGVAILFVALSGGAEREAHVVSVQ